MVGEQYLVKRNPNSPTQSHHGKRNLNIEIYQTINFPLPLYQTIIFPSGKSLVKFQKWSPPERTLEMSQRPALLPPNMEKPHLFMQKASSATARRPASGGQRSAAAAAFEAQTTQLAKGNALHWLK